tara:strand:+ start:866 stop:1096 length:231 start_codon:yes stop_codon:yes gene_type:complete
MDGGTKSIIDLAAQGLKFLSPNVNGEQRQTRKNIRLAFRNYKRICKEIEKNGVTPEEQVMLETLLKQLAESQSKLI